LNALSYTKSSSLEAIDQSHSLSTSPEKQTAQKDLLLALGIVLPLIFQILFLILAGTRNINVLSPDGVAYLRIASYYTQGKFELAVSGYWGPLLSWLMALWLPLVENPLIAARIAMGLSAVVFLVGSILIFRSFEIHPAAILLGALITAVSSAAWSVETITSDLLMSGLMCIAMSRMLTPRWLESRSLQATAGVFWGIAYLAKAVAFPLAFIISGAIALLWLIGRWCDRKIIARSLTTTLVAFLSVAGVWIFILSLKYEKVVVSTNGTINYANVGPANTMRGHPSFMILHQPEAGRITSWEDPTSMSYQLWSPFENLKNAKHQLILISWNVEMAFTHLLEFSTPQFGLFAIIFGLLVHTPWRKNLKAERWRWAGVIVACIVGIYLPVYGEEQRHYYATYPFLFAASVGMVTWLTREFRGRIAWPHLIGLAVVTICFAIPAYAALKRASIRTAEKQQAAYARDLAKKLQVAGVHGSIAGGGECGLYVAFFSEQTWFGDQQKPTAESLEATQAKLVIVPRYQSLSAELDRHPAFTNLDSLLFDHNDDAKKFPLTVFEIVSH